MKRCYPWILTATLLILAGSGCQTLREIAQLRNVHFAIDRVADVRLAGVDLQRIQSFEDLSATDVLRLGAAVTRREAPFDLKVHLRAENPPENQVQARLVRMDWTLFLDDRETVSGVLDQSFVLPPGEATDVPIPISLDLFEFFDHGARDLVELVLAVAGQGGEPKRIRLQATPTIDTPIGSIRYPQPITIISQDVGS
ncbi:MAG: LEA type 2 family protein [Rhodothermales bacterium]